MTIKPETSGGGGIYPGYTEPVEPPVGGFTDQHTAAGGVIGIGGEALTDDFDRIVEAVFPDCGGLRLYPSGHLAGSVTTPESEASPDLDSSNRDAAWDDFTGTMDYWQLYDDPAASTSTSNVVWSRVNAPAGNIGIAGFVHRLDGVLLASIQSGGTVRAQFRGSARFGIGIDEGAQVHYAKWCIRVYRPGTGFVATLVTVAAYTGAANFPASSTPLNRAWTATFAAFAGAQEGDYVVVDMGVRHNAPTSGGTGATIHWTDTAGSDLPEDESTSTNLNAYIEFFGTAGPTQGQGGWGEGPLGVWAFPDQGVWEPALHRFSVNGDCAEAWVADETVCDDPFRSYNSLIGLSFEQCNWPLELLMEVEFPTVLPTNVDNLLEVYWRLEQAGFEFYNQFGAFNADYNAVEGEWEVLNEPPDPQRIFWGLTAQSEIDSGSTPGPITDYDNDTTPWIAQSFLYRVRVEQSGVVVAKLWNAGSTEPEAWQRQSYIPNDGFSSAGFGHLMFYPISFWDDVEDTWLRICRITFVSGLCGGVMMQGSGAYPMESVV